jgi:hypothetical protein
MDKKQFCDETVVKLRDLDRVLELETLAPPSTFATAMQQAKRLPRLEEARTRVTALRARLDAVRADGAPLTDAVRIEIEQKLSEIRGLLA